MRRTMRRKMPRSTAKIWGMKCLTAGPPLRSHVCVRIEARDIKRVDILHPPPYVGGQLLGAQFPIPLPIAETARKRFELVRVLFRKNQIARVAAHYPERVDQISQKEVSRA